MSTKIIKKISKYDNHGRGITYHDDKIMFVKNALKDEEVSIKNINFKKKYYEAETDEIIKSSRKRVVPKCPYYNSCGGCNIMHMNYAEQLNFKTNRVKEILLKYADLDVEVKLIENDKQLFYRNKVTLKVIDNRWGFYNDESHDLVEINNCLISQSAINDIIKKHDFIAISSGEVVIRCNYQSEVLIAITSDKDVKIDESLIPNNVKGIVVNDKVEYLADYFYDLIDGQLFKVSYDSFFQVNNYMAGRIFNVLKSNLSGEKLLDLYCGVGTLGLSVANNYKEIHGIEIVKNACLNASTNASMNNITNATYYSGTTDKVLLDININFDTIIVDPPRSGLNNKTLEQIIDLKPNIVAYISCDPLTFARDLKVLKNYYNINKVNVLDMFPNTYHVECITVLNLKENI